jgi:hypothetical protein
MKIGKSELDQTLVQKIERLDGVVGNFSEDDRGGFLSYNGSDFVVRKVADTSLRRVFSESEVAAMEASIYEESGIIKNSFRGGFNRSNQASRSFRTLEVSPKEDVIFKSDSRIVLSKHSGKSLFFVNSRGILVKLDVESGKTVAAADVSTELRSKLAVQSKGEFEFLAMEVYGESGVLLSTRSNGVLFYDLEARKIEVKFPENGVTMIRNLGGGLIMCAADRVDNNVMFFSFETGMKTESSNALRKGVFQNPVLSDSYNDHLFVVGRPYAANTTRGILHYWRKDAAKIAFNNADSEVFQGLDYLDHSVRNVLLTEDSLYLSGINSKGALFIWQYDVKRLSEPFKEIPLTRLKLGRLDFIDFNEEHIVAAEGDRVYFIGSDSTVHKNLKLTSKTDLMFFSGKDELIQVSGDKIVRIKVPEYKESREVTLSIYESDAACNNIDIIVKGCRGTEKFAFFNTETLDGIAPYYIASYRDKTIVKLYGATAKSISMKIAVESGTEIEGVAVKADRLFLK